MIRFGTYIRMELKRMQFHIRPLIIGAVLLLALAAVFVLLAVNRSGDSAIRKTTVGLVLDPEDAFSKRLPVLMEAAPEIRDVFDIKMFTETEGIRALQSGEIETLFIVPKDFIRSLVNGSNYPVEIRYPAERIGLMTLLIRQLTDAASHWILDTEAGIYAVKDWYREIGSRMPEDKENELNWIYLNQLLARQDFIRTDVIQTEEGLSGTEYYITAAIVLWLLFLGLCCYDMAGRQTGAMADRVALYGLSHTGQRAASLLGFLVTYSATAFAGLLIPMLLAGFLPGFPFRILAVLPVVILIAGAFIFMICSLFKNAPGAMMFMLLFTLSAGYVSGLFYPLSFLPVVFSRVAPFLPTRVMFETLATAVRGDGNGAAVGIALGYTAVLAVMSLIPAAVRDMRIREKKDYAVEKGG